MILYRLSAGEDGILHPPAQHTAYPSGTSTPGSPSRGGTLSAGHMYAPPTPAWNRNSAYSSSDAGGDSVLLEGDTKYPSLGGTPRGSFFGLAGLGLVGGGGVGVLGPGTPGGKVNAALDDVALGMRAGTAEMGTLGRAQGGLVAYVWDPDDEDDDEDEEPAERWMHDPSTVNPLYAKDKSAAGSPGAGGADTAGSATPYYIPRRTVSVRGVGNVTALVALVLGLLCLFIVFPITKTLADNGVALKILENTRINATGQAISRRSFAVEFEREAE